MSQLGDTPCFTTEASYRVIKPFMKSYLKERNKRLMNVVRVFIFNRTEKRFLKQWNYKTRTVMCDMTIKINERQTGCPNVRQKAFLSSFVWRCMYSTYSQLNIRAFCLMSLFNCVAVLSFDDWRGLTCYVIYIYIYC